jgi:hypothetical protein
MKILYTFIACFIINISVYSQEKEYAKWIINKLASPEMKGRGYVDKGDLKAAKFIASEMSRHGLKPLYKKYLQEYIFSINTFPGDMNLYVDGKELKPGMDYLVSLASPQTKGNFELQWLLNDSIKDSPLYSKLMSSNLSGSVIVTDKYHKEFSDTNLLRAAGYIYLKDSASILTWRASNGHKLKDFFVLDIKTGKVTPQNRAIYLNFEQEFIPEYSTNNVAGMITGQKEPDSFMLITAHYDHLGMMGEHTLFPGANDNASGVAAMLNLAKHFSMPGNEPACSMVFIALSGEEAGLLGAEYCAQTPPVALQNIRFLVNLDMVGTGSDGITVVQANIYPKAYDLLVKINADNEFIRQVKSRGESCNSDHCPFYKKGVPSVFIYSMGSEWPHYHDPGDTPDKLPLTEYDDIIRLLVNFIKRY